LLQPFLFALWGEFLCFLFCSVAFSLCLCNSKKPSLVPWGESFAKSTGRTFGGESFAKAKEKAKVKSPQEHLGEFKQRFK